MCMTCTCACACACACHKLECACCAYVHAVSHLHVKNFVCAVPTPVRLTFLYSVNRHPRPGARIPSPLKCFTATPKNSQRSAEAWGASSTHGFRPETPLKLAHHDPPQRYSSSARMASARAARLPRGSSSSRPSASTITCGRQGPEVTARREESRRCPRPGERRGGNQRGAVAGRAPFGRWSPPSEAARP